MSLRSGADFVAGNLSLKLQDRIYNLVRSLEGGIEYYDVYAPVGINMAIGNNSRYLFFVSGTNTTSSPKLRVDAVQLNLVNNYGNPVGIGDLVDGAMVELYCTNVSTGNIYMRSSVTSYTSLTEKPYINNVLIAGSKSLQDYGAAESRKEGNDLILKLNTKTYGSIKFGTYNTFEGEIYNIGAANALAIITSKIKPVWDDGLAKLELATTEDVANLVLPDNYKGSVQYARLTAQEMNAIATMINGDKCLVASENIVYTYDEAWIAGDPLTVINSDYFEVENFIDGDTGRAIYNGDDEDWDFRKVRTIIYSDSLTYYDITLLADNWVNNEYVIEDILLSDGDKLLVYPASGSNHDNTVAIRNAFVAAQISYQGDDVLDTVTVTADLAPTIDLNVIVEVRK